MIYYKKEIRLLIFYKNIRTHKEEHVQMEHPSVNPTRAKRVSVLMDVFRKVVIQREKGIEDH
jgi:hypothetical protein